MGLYRVFGFYRVFRALGSGIRATGRMDSGP